ncbi:hypothetical protein IW262DRAFT_686803 [Armillaria fumosa]|nr:hypothetical protein IW262DRAFT_686803 [Armillaria fumosa]
MYPQELIDKIVDHLHDSPCALKACSFVSHQFYSRTRVHLFRCVNCLKPETAQVFDIARNSPDLLQCIRRVQFWGLSFFLPKHYPTSVDLLHSLSVPVTLCIWNDSAVTRMKNVNGDIFCLYSSPRLPFSPVPNSSSSLPSGTPFQSSAISFCPFLM